MVKREFSPSIVDDAEDIDSQTELASLDDPEEIIISDENWKEIEKQFGDDSDGFIIFCDWIDEIPPRDIATQYSIDVKDVYNTIKKGKRIITKIFTS